MGRSPFGNDVDVQLLEKCHHLGDATCSSGPGFVLISKEVKFWRIEFEKNNYHFAFQKFSNIFFKNEFSFCFNPCLLPNRMLREKFVGSTERSVMENIRIAFKHVTNSRPQL